MIKICITTLGCPKNVVDSEKLLGSLNPKFMQITDDIARADFVIINTCSFLESSREESIKTILEIINFKEKHTLNFKIAVIGCMVAHFPQEIKKELPEIDHFLTFQDYGNLNAIIQNTVRQTKRSLKKFDPFDYNNPINRHSLTLPHLAYLKIAEGCNNYCTFCVIPKIRGKYKSRPEEEILKEAKALSKKGCKELILIAQDTSFYGQDIYHELRLPTLLKKLARIKGIKWIRLMYTYPNYLTDELIETIASEDKICKYLDIPLQHINNRILKDMKRGITKEKIKHLLQKIKTKIPAITIRTSLIVGFPGETKAEYEELSQFIQEQQFDRLGVFTYSQEENTKAAAMKKQVSERIKQERQKAIMLAQQKIMQQKNKKLVGKKIKILLDKRLNNKENTWIGRSSGDAPEIDQIITVLLPKGVSGEFINIEVTNYSTYELKGKKIKA